MNLIDKIPLTGATIPLAAFVEHLRLGTGFSDDGAQNSVLETCLKAAIYQIESRTGKRLTNRPFDWVVSQWRLEGGEQEFPLVPVSVITRLRLYRANGTSNIIGITKYGLRNDTIRPRLYPKVGSLPVIEPHGWAVISFFAGYGAWEDVPGDLQQAVMMLATFYYENRDGMVADSAQIPLAVSVLLEPHKRLRIGATR